MKVNISIELTPTLIETLSPDQLKDIIYQFLAIEAESKVKNKVNISANAESALNALKSTKEAIADIITEKGDNTPIEIVENKNSIPTKDTNEFIKNNTPVESAETILIKTPKERKVRKVQKPSEFIKAANGEDIPMSKVADLYKNGISLAKICKKYGIKTTTLFSRLNRLGLTAVKKKS
jgi:hypothetical protein